MSLDRGLCRDPALVPHTRPPRKGGHFPFAPASGSLRSTALENGGRTSDCENLPIFNLLLQRLTVGKVAVRAFAIDVLESYLDCVCPLARPGIDHSCVNAQGCRPELV